MTLLFKDAENTTIALKSRAVSGEQVGAHDVISLPGTSEADILASKGFLQTLAGVVTSNRAAVDLTATVNGYLQKLSDAYSSNAFNVLLSSAINTRIQNIETYLNTLQGAVATARIAVDLATTPTANLATLAAAITAARMQVDLATTPTANLATLAAAISAARMQVDLATTPTTNLATLAAAITAARMQVDLATTPTANLASIAASSAVPTALYGGKTTVTTAGTRVVLASTQVLLKGVWVRGLDANTGLMYVGNVSVSSTAAGTRLTAGESVFIEISNLNTVNLDSAVSGEGVTYLGW